MEFFSSQHHLTMKQFNNLIYINVFSIVFTIGIPLIFFFTQDPIPLYRKDSYNLFKQCKTCDIAKARAVEDFNNGKLQIVLWGLPDSKDPSPQELFLAEKYNIKSIQGGCTSFTELDCYNTEMMKLIFAKFNGKIFPL